MAINAKVPTKFPEIYFTSTYTIKLPLADISFGVF